MYINKHNKANLVLIYIYLFNKGTIYIHIYMPIYIPIHYIYLSPFNKCLMKPRASFPATNAACLC